jgi:hypothetical protein
MATPNQIAANQQNAQLSTGPATPAGRERSSQNSTVHGFTGKRLIVKPGEAEAYHKHVQAYLDEFEPDTHKLTDLVHQFADLQWSLHQIFIEQNTVIALMESIHEQDDPIQAAASLARSLNTLSLYETRRRRAAKAVEEEIISLQKTADDLLAKDLARAVPLYKICKAQGKTFDPLEFGFVCSLENIGDYIDGQRIADEEARILNMASQPRVPEKIQKDIDRTERELKAMDAGIEQLLKKVSD